MSSWRLAQRLMEAEDAWLGVVENCLFLSWMIFEWISIYIVMHLFMYHP